MGLNAKQKEAVEYLEGPLLVLAGPGTGKTQLLSEKVAYILKNTDTNPENILCLTFTETGVKNMQERLKSIVGKAGTRVTVGTYHAFGQEILAQYKNYTDDYDRNLDNAIDEVTQFKIVKKIRDGLSGNDILRGDNVKDIISVISDAKSAGLAAGDLQKIAEQNIEDSGVISKAISPLLLEVVPRAFKESYENAYAPIYEILKQYEEMPPILKNVERTIVGLARDLSEAIKEATAAEKIKPLTEWKDKYFEKDENGNYRLKDKVANKKLASIANVMTKYQVYLKENGLFDFDDMIEEAIRVLNQNTGFRLTLSERYQFIMLDEFQDTNPSQFMIVKKITDYEKPMIMAVGDDDQAIYEFQGALSTNLTDFQEYYNANVIALVENYRSTQEILDFSREIIKQAPDRFADKELVAHKPNPASSQIYRREFLSSDSEYGFIAKSISDLIKRGVKQNEIAIISYKTKYFMPLLPYLKSYPEIKIAYEKRDNLLEDAKMHQIITISKLICELAKQKQDGNLLLEVLSYPFFELPILEVVKILGEAREGHKSFLDCLLNAKNSKIQNVVRFLSDLTAESFNEPIEVILNQIVQIINPDKFDEYEKFVFYENLASLLGKTTRHFGEKALRISDLVEMVDDYNEAEMPLNTTSPYRDADEAIQVLTAHKAKGLEFEYVFLISADHVAWGKGKGNNNLLALPKNLIQIRHTGTTDGEKLRVLYVAMTRAKSHLIMTNSLYDFNGKSPDRLEYLEEYESKNPETDIKEVISPFLPTKKVILDYGESAVQTSEKQTLISNLEHWIMPYVVYSPDMRSIYKERAENYKMSATGLTSFIDIIHAGPVEFFKREILKAPREPENVALITGNLMHATFEAVTNKGISDEEAITFFENELNKKIIDEDTAKAIHESGTANLALSLKTFGDVLRKGKAEINLNREHLAVEGVPITGQIDHIVIDEKAKTIEIYDFKTGAYRDGKWHSDETLFKYMLQLSFYKLLLNNSPSYGKYSVAKGHILFVTADKKDEKVHDKIYEFNEKDDKQLKELIRAVYAQITSLNFMDDKEIFLKADKNKKLKDIKEFIELVLAKKIDF